MGIVHFDGAVLDRKMTFCSLDLRNAIQLLYAPHDAHLDGMLVLRTPCANSVQIAKAW